MSNKQGARIIQVRVKPNSKKDSIEFTSETECTIRTTAPAVENKANERVIEMVADYYGVAKRQIELMRGHKSKIKTIKINF
jgi:hypothetical protein